MLQTATLSFLKKLGKNNNKPWFDEHRKEYEAAKKDFEQFITSLLEKMAALDPAFKEQKGKDTVFRIFRDVRFSKNKTPYKAHFGAYLSRGGRKSPDAGYYLHLEPGGKSFLAGGLWMPEGTLLKKVRQEVDYNYKEFQSILTSPSFKKLFTRIEGETLKTLPQGYAADNPAIAYLKLKSFIVTTQLKDEDFGTKTVQTNIMKIFTTMKPFVDFLNRAMD